MAIKKQINISVDDKKLNPKVNNIKFTLELAKNSSMQMAKNIKKPKINEMMSCFFLDFVFVTSSPTQDNKPNNKSNIKLT
ncbi:hypothetical protein AO376_1958 [Moraxella catarrhalis]|nr:hypothetical protein AO376_1958 [Moraxella catarrhalis]